MPNNSFKPIPRRRLTVGCFCLYPDTLRAGGSEQVERAMRLVPLKLAHELRAYARALGCHTHTLV